MIRLTSRRTMLAVLFRVSTALLVWATCAVATIMAADDPQAARQPQVVEAEHGLVVAVSRPGSETGRDVLKKGGNAVDAAVATALAMAVSYPPAGNIGGGGFMLIHPGGPTSGRCPRPPVCIDYRETAPAAANRNTFSLDDGRHTRKIVGVPGTVAGLWLAHEKYGKLPWKNLVLPAVKLAEEGFEIDAHLADSLNKVLADKATKPHTEFLRVFSRQKDSGDGPKDSGGFPKSPESAPPESQPAESQWKEGDRLVQPDLAKTLRRIAEHGADGFYRGPVAEMLVAEMKRGEGDGLISLEDLAGYRAKVREPIHTTFRGHDVYGPPPPSSGGITLALMLNMLERHDLRKQGRWSPQTMHLLIETMKRAYLERARHLGDADFVKIPRRLTRKRFAARLDRQIDPDKATPSEQLAPDIPLAGEGESTTHFSVIDAAGMAVANTYTLENSYGSRVVVTGAGFLLNNEMGDFNWKPGHTDRRGRIGTEPNTIQPGKRMLSSQCPTIVAQDGRVVLVTGSPGGRTIINTSLLMVLNVVEFRMDLRTATAAPRLHHQWLPDAARFEAADRPEYKELIDQLRAKGHTINTNSYTQGDAHSISVTSNPGRYLGVADDRRSGFAAGY